MKRAIIVLMLLVAPMVLAGVHVESDPEFDLGAYSTYAWREGTPARRESAEKLIRAGVDRELNNARLQRVDASADLWVVTHVLADEHSLEDLRDKNYWEFLAGIQSVDAYDLGRGTLVVDLIDVRLEQVVWRGVVSRAIGKNVKANSRKVDKAIRAVMRSLTR